MPDPSRALVGLGLVSLLLAPLPAAAAPGEPAQDAVVPADDAAAPPGDAAVPPGVEGPPLDTDEGERPLDTDDFDTDTDTDTDTGEGPAVDDDGGESLDDGYQFLRDSPEARAARRWLRAGVAATSVGAVLVGGGVAMALTDPCDPNAGNNCFDDARNRAAATMGIPGAVLLVGGVAMTIVGSLQKRRLFFERANAGLTVGRDHIGLVVAGRF